VDAATPLLWFADKAVGAQQRRRRIRVLVHRAIFLPRSPEHFFVKVINLSPSREIEITHIWFETQPPFHVLNPERPLPARLRLDETFETWVPVAALPQTDKIEHLARVHLSSGRTVKSRLNKRVPLVGNVAGAGSH
jgi:hypothetical protein